MSGLGLDPPDLMIVQQENKRTPVDTMLLHTFFIASLGQGDDPEVY